MKGSRPALLVKYIHKITRIGLSCAYRRLRNLTPLPESKDALHLPPALLRTFRLWLDYRDYCSSRPYSTNRDTRRRDNLYGRIRRVYLMLRFCRRNVCTLYMRVQIRSFRATIGGHCVCLMKILRSSTARTDSDGILGRCVIPGLRSRTLSPANAFQQSSERVSASKKSSLNAAVEGAYALIINTTWSLY